MTTPEKKRRPRERIRETREEHIRIWLELVGFNGDFEQNAADFIAYKLGFSDAYLRAILLGNRDLGVQSALQLNAMLPRTARAKSFDYKVLTHKVRELLDITEEQMALEPVSDCFEDAIPVDPELLAKGAPGLDENGRPQIFIVLSDGQVYLVKLPNGTEIDSVPWVATGDAGTTGTCGFQFAAKPEQ